MFLWQLLLGLMEIHKLYSVPKNYLWKFESELKQKNKQAKNQNNF